MNERMEQRQAALQGIPERVNSPCYINDGRKMADILLRVGLWLVAAVLALFILVESNHDEPWAAMIPRSTLQQGLVLAAALVVAGIIARLLGRGARAVTKQRCKVCRAPVASGAIYCREHLRNILHEEDEKFHTTRPGR